MSQLIQVQQSVLHTFFFLIVCDFRLDFDLWISKVSYWRLA
jgi:hypothetical protein